MSLVVAKITPRGIRIVSDSKVTDPEAVKHGYLYGTIKAVIINQNLCICYAGKAGVGQVAIDSIRSHAKKIEGVCQRLLDAHKEANEETDFIIAALKPTKLFKISNGDIQETDSSCWIGDSDGFNIFQKYLHQTNPSNIPDSDYLTSIKMETAMREVISEPSIPRVGEFSISVASTKNGFNYMLGQYRAAGFLPQSIPSGVLTPIQFGNAASGGFSYHIMSPDNAGIGALGIYFPEGSFGAFFYPEKSWEPIIFRGDFVLEIQKKYNVSLIG